MTQLNAIPRIREKNDYNFHHPSPQNTYQLGCSLQNLIFPTVCSRPGTHISHLTPNFDTHWAEILSKM